MIQAIKFPAVHVKKTGRGFEGMAGIRLLSILKGDLLIHEDGHKESKVSLFHLLDPENQQKIREAFLQTIAGWDDNVSLEMHLNVEPNLACRPQGTITIGILIRAAGASKKDVRERLIGHYLALMPLIATHFSEAEFAPLTSENELISVAETFKPVHAISIQRDQGVMSISSLVKASVISGFLQKESEPESYSHKMRHIFPWVPSMDDWSKLIQTLMLQLDPVKIVVRLQAARASRKTLNRLEDIISTCESYMPGDSLGSVAYHLRVKLLRDISLRMATQLAGACLNIGVFLVSNRKIDNSLAHLVGCSITAGRDSEREEYFQGGFMIKDTGVRKALARGYFPENEPFSITEAACAFRLPSPPIGELVGIPLKRFRTSLAQIPRIISPSRDRIKLFVNEHQGMTQPVKVGVEDRMRHMFILGQTGTGKSTLMESMILNDIRSGKGLAVVDPHGDMVDEVLQKMPIDRADDVIVFDLLDRERPLGFNLLQWESTDERDLIIDELYMTVDRIYNMSSTGGPIFEQYFRGVLKLLTGDKHRADFTPTLLEFTLCFQNSEFRDWLRKSISDPVTLDFVDEMQKAGGDARLENVSPYITSKLNRFLNDQTLKRIVGQEKTAFDFEEVINQGKVLFIKLGKGRFGSTTSALIANQIVARFKLAAMKRGEMPPKDRREFYLYVDECHNLPTDNFTELLSEARKYRMGLVLATQYTGQLSNKGEGGSRKGGNNDLLEAILGNVGTIVSFRIGQEDAQKIGQMFEPFFSFRDICGLPNWNGYTRIQLNNDVTPPFSFRTCKDESKSNPENAKKIKTLSRLKYGTDCQLVDAMINNRRKVWK